MAYYNDVYNSPEKHGLQIIDSMNLTDESYSFDIFAVWYHAETNRWFYGQDSGCSCPSPFEDFTDESSLSEFHTWSELDVVLTERISDSPLQDSYRYSFWNTMNAKRADMVTKVRNTMQETNMTSSQTPEPDEQAPIDIDIVDAVQMLIKASVNLAQRQALLELAMGEVQQSLANMSDDGK
jgi:hypothetical protein